MEVALSCRGPRRASSPRSWDGSATTRHCRSERQYCFWQISSSSCPVSSQAWEIGHGQCTLTMLVVWLTHSAWLDLIYIVCSLSVPWCHRYLWEQTQTFSPSGLAFLSKENLRAWSVEINNNIPPWEPGQGRTKSSVLLLLIELVGFGGGWCCIAMQRTLWDARSYLILWILNSNCIRTKSKQIKTFFCLKGCCTMNWVHLFLHKPDKPQSLLKTDNSEFICR